MCTEEKGGVVHVLNIVVPESRVLASRERCPYLVRLEVVETGLEGDDPRLYASGFSRVGVTVEEALGLKDFTKTTNSSYHETEIPRLLDDGSGQQTSSALADSSFVSPGTEHVPRGGWQVDMDGADFDYGNPYNYDNVRQHEYEQLHQQMQEQPVAPQQPLVAAVNR